MVNSTYNKAKVITLALFFSFLINVNCQNTDYNNEYLFEQNHWGFQILSGISPAHKIDYVPNKYVRIKFLPNYQFGGGFIYNFNIKKKYAIETGFLAEFKSENTVFSFNSIEINKDLNIVPTDPLLTNEDWIYHKTKELTFGQFYQSFSVPILFKFNFLVMPKFVLSAKTGVNTRFYFSSSYSGGASYNSDKKEIFVFDYEILVNEHNRVELDNQTGISIGFVLKNKKLLSLSFISNIALYKVNKGSIIYLYNTPLEERSSIKINDNYFGLTLSYMFTGVPNPKNNKIKNRKIEWFPKKDEY